MFSFLKGKIFRWAVDRSFRKQAPRKFSYASTNNFYVSTIELPNDNTKVLLDKWKDNRLCGLAWDGDKFHNQVDFSLAEAMEARLEVNRFYGYHQLTYKSLSEFVGSEITLRPQRVWVKSLFQKWSYDRSVSFRHDRIEVLRRLTELHIKQGEKDNPLLYDAPPKSVVSLFSEIYGQRVFSHPKYNIESARFRLLVSSLAESGDLVRENKHEFRLSAKSLQTLAEYELDERRHQDSVVHNRRLVLLTVVIALAAAAQAYGTFRSP